VRVCFQRVSLLALPLVALAASGCSGTGSVPVQSSSPPQLGSTNILTRGPLQTAIAFTLPAKIDAGETSPHYRGVKFVSPAVQGIEIAERCTGGTAPNCAGSAVGNAQTAVPGGSGQNQQILYYLASSVCNNASPRVCSVSFPSYPVAAAQGAQFEIDLLDAAPASNASTAGPASANLLGAGLSPPSQSPSGATPVTITTPQGIVGNIAFLATSVTGTVSDGAGSNFGNSANAKLQVNFGAGPIFVASYIGAGNGNGPAISGKGLNVAQDLGTNLIGDGNSGCVVDGADEYGNSLTPSGSNDASDALNNSTNGSVYAQLTPTSGQTAHHYFAEVLAGEAYIGTTNALLGALVQPCGQSSTTSFGASGAGNAKIGLAGSDFPGDFFSWQYNPTNKPPTVSNPVSANGGQTGEATSLFSFGPSAPYFGLMAVATQPYKDASTRYAVPSVFLYWIDQPIYGEAYIPSGSNGTIGCVQNAGTQTTSSAPAEALDAGPTSGAAGSFSSGGACVQGMIVNLFGTASGTSTTAYVYALQNWKPTGGTYSATPNAACSGVVAITGPTGNLFQKTGTLGTDGSTVVPYAPGANPGNGGGAFWKLSAGSTANANTSTSVSSSACVITFSDGFNSFNVTVTNVVSTALPPISHGPSGGWGPYAVANAFQFPVQSGFNGAGTTVAIIGDNPPALTDLSGYLVPFNITFTGTYRVQPVGAGSPMTDQGGLFESTLDIETVMGLAPGANIIYYSMPDASDQSFLGALNQILSDQQTNVVSISYGGCESGNLATFDSLLAQGASQGIAIAVSSGDWGDRCTPTSFPGVDYPASDPHVIGVGGTESSSSIASTRAWNDLLASSGQTATGGGVSAYYALPQYQSGLAGEASTTNRNVPDVAMPADIVAVYYQGQWVGAVGTSWGAPQVAAQVAEIYQYCNAAFVNPVNIFYHAYAVSGYSDFLDVTTGNNRFKSDHTYFSAAPGFDNVSGIGIPLGMPIAQTICPNRVPVSLARATRGTLALVAHGPAAPTLVNNLADLRNLKDLGRRAADEPTRVALVLRATSSLAEDEQIVIASLRAAGIAVTETYANHLVLNAEAPASVLANYLQTEFRNFEQGGHGIRYANVSPVVLPAAIAPYVQGLITDNLILTSPTPHRVR